MKPTIAVNHAGLADINDRIARAAKDSDRDIGAIQLIAVSKTFDAVTIEPAILAGQRRFGENRVQEAQQKWPDLIGQYPDIELHLIGPLQSNKAADAVALFDVIHTIDRDKIARAIAAEMTRQNRQPRLLVQVNTGLEPQKAGIAPDDLPAFIERCWQEHGLTIEGLMCIPPVDDPPSPHFALLAKLAKACGLPHLSMGMSGDFEAAIQQGATMVRVGSAIFGQR